MVFHWLRNVLVSACAALIPALLYFVLPFVLLSVTGLVQSKNAIALSAITIFAIVWKPIQKLQKELEAKWVRGFDPAMVVVAVENKTISPEEQRYKDIAGLLKAGKPPEEKEDFSFRPVFLFSLTQAFLVFDCYWLIGQKYIDDLKSVTDVLLMERYYLGSFNNENEFLIYFFIIFISLPFILYKKLKYSPAYWFIYLGEGLLKLIILYVDFFLLLLAMSLFFGYFCFLFIHFSSELADVISLAGSIRIEESIFTSNDLLYWVLSLFWLIVFNFGLSEAAIDFFKNSYNKFFIKFEIS